MAVGSRTITADDLSSLSPDEYRSIERAVAKRQDEFATGRALLHRLLDHDGSIAVGADRSPVWPPGVRGSLAHDRRFAVAAVSRDDDVRSIGIDIEPIESLSPGLPDVILRTDEQGIDAHLAFTLKEATYKAWSALGGTMLEHHDVRLQLEDQHVGDGTFLADVVGAVAPVGAAAAVDSPDSTDGQAATISRFAGRYAMVLERWVALVVVRRSDGTGPAPRS